MEPIFEYRKRPLVKTGEKSMQSRKHGAFVMVYLRFIDGYQPSTGKMTRGDFGRLRQIRGGQALVWHRVDHLTRDERMEPKRALAQATAEYSKGVLTC